MISAEKLLGLFPPFRDERILIKEDQKVHDIIKQILISHEKYAAYYDKIAPYFDADSVEKICEHIYSFLKKNVKYVEESEHYQTTALPTAILSWKEGDCKHYASFSGGVLSAIERLTGKKIDWCYRFCSYDLLTKSPHHVFVVVFDQDREIWIDPVPGANGLHPVWQLDKKIKNNSMALYDVIGGIPGEHIEMNDDDLPQHVKDAIELLLQYNIFDENGELDQAKINQLSFELYPYQLDDINNAIKTIAETQSIGGFFQNVARAIKKVALAPARGAFLGLVALNFRAWATNMKKIIATPDGVNAIRDKWYPLGGDWVQLENAINNGAQKKMLGSVDPDGVGSLAAATAFLVAATPIIAVMVPLIKQVLANKGIQDPWAGGGAINPATGMPYTVDPATGLPYTSPMGTGNFMDWIKANPIPVIAVVGIGGYLLLQKKKKVTGKKENSTLLFIAGAVGIYFLTRKKEPPTPTPPIVTDPSIPTEPVVTQPMIQAVTDPSDPFYGAKTTVNQIDPFPPLEESANYGGVKQFYSIDQPMDQFGNQTPINFV